MLELISANKDLHMILCDERIFNRWIDIMEKYIIGEIANNKGEHSNKQAVDLARVNKMQVEGTTQLSATMFRCLQGLVDEEILKIQEMIFRGTLLLKRAKNLTTLRNMEDMALSFKNNRVLKNDIVEYFKSLSGEESLSYKSTVEKYKITKEIYDKLYKWSKDWMRDSINKAKRKTYLPEVVKIELRLAHAKAFGLYQHLKFERPWKIFNTSKVLSCFTNVIAACGASNDIGLVVLDTTSQGQDSGWDVDAFKRLVECIAGLISGDSYVLVAILPYGPVLSALDVTLRHIIGTVHLEYGSYTKGDASIKKYTSSHDLVVVMAMISKEEGKNIWNDLIPIDEIPSIIFDENESDSEDDPSFTEKETFLEKNITYESCGLQGGSINRYPKKSTFFSGLIKSLCQKGKVVVDAYTGGFAMREALQSQKKSIVFVNDTSEKELLEAYASKMVECMPNVNSFYKSFGEEKDSNVQISSSSHAKPLPEDFLSDINKSSHELLSIQEGYVGLEGIIEDTNNDEIASEEAHESMTVGETSVLRQAS